MEIPQTARTNGVFLSKPYWMWGAEMGVNEHGLVIGNEAIYSKIPANKEPALLGMDFLRLALERASTPREALQVIIDLLEQFGQGGNCGSHGNDLYYHNSFLIANADEAWVLETIDKQWAAKQVNDIYTISNCLTLGRQFDLSSKDLHNITGTTKDLHLANDLNDILFTNFGKGLTRRNTTLNALEANKGSVNIESMMQTLRHHKADDFDPSADILEQDVCMHAGFGPFRISQSTASMVMYLDGNSPVIFATGTAAPCTSLFKPFWMDTASFLNDEPAPTHLADSNSLFWQHERLHRAVLMNYDQRLKAYVNKRDKMEMRFIEGAMKIKSALAKERMEFSQQCYIESRAAEAEWLKRVETIPSKKPLLHSVAWGGFNKKARLKSL